MNLLNIKNLYHLYIIFINYTLIYINMFIEFLNSYDNQCKVIYVSGYLDNYCKVYNENFINYYII